MAGLGEVRQGTAGTALHGKPIQAIATLSSARHGRRGRAKQSMDKARQAKQCAAWSRGARQGTVKNEKGEKINPMAYLNDTGLPSVTEILKNFINMDWFTQEAKERGTAVHEVCHAHLTGGHLAPLPPDWNGYFESFCKWCEVARPEVEIAEKRLIDTVYHFCGQPDFIGRTAIRQGRGLIDFKTSILFERWHRLQGAAYRHLANCSQIETQWGAMLRLRQNGTLALMDYLPDDYLLDFNRFVMALSLHNFFN